MTNDRFYHCQFPVKAFQLTSEVYHHAELWPDWLRDHLNAYCLITRRRDGVLLLSDRKGQREIENDDWIVDLLALHVLDDPSFRKKFSLTEQKS